MKNNAFESARIKLTLWYLVIIMPITILFSGIIYRLTTNQIEGFVREQNRRIQEFRQRPRLNAQIITDLPDLIDTQELIEQEYQLFYTLVLINLAILLLAGGGGYLLAGLTLKPIKQMVEDQNNFISSSSHELRTPVTVLRAEMEASLLEKNITDKMSRSLIKSNLEELSSLQKLIDHLLQITRINDGNIGLIDKVDINSLIHQAEKKVAPLAKIKKIKININSVSAKINGDKDRLLELLVILLDNAIKYSSPDTQINLISEIKNNRLFITVQDHGQGISSTDLPHVFEKFYRADKSRSKTDGFGLGLSIAKKIVEAHSGFITVKSQINEGASFEINFPLIKK